MNPLFLAPILGLVLGAGGVATAHAHGLQEWKNHMTDEQIATLHEAKDLFQEGNVEEARDLIKEANLPLPPHGLVRHMDPEKKADIEAALDAGDYNAFVEFFADTPFIDGFTQEKFNALVEARELHQAGNDEAARETLKEADIHPFKHHAKMHVKHFVKEKIQK